VDRLGSGPRGRNGLALGAAAEGLARRSGARRSSPTEAAREPLPHAVGFPGGSPSVLGTAAGAPVSGPLGQRTPTGSAPRRPLPAHRTDKKLGSRPLHRDSGSSSTRAERPWPACAACLRTRDHLRDSGAEEGPRF
jgi:hypothetical protein